MFFLFEFNAIIAFILPWRLCSAEFVRSVHFSRHFCVVDLVDRYQSINLGNRRMRPLVWRLFS